MNLILFEPAEIGPPLPRSDRRALHLLSVLRRAPGEPFDAGLVNGPRGKATIVSLDATSLTLAFTPTVPAVAPEPITLIVGLPRPQTARDILRDATTAGVAALHFVRTEKSEPSYAQSTLWSSSEWRRHALLGAEQAFDTRLPEITSGRSLADVLTALPAGLRIALDNYESPTRLGALDIPPAPAVTLALGSERGWSTRERDLLSAHAFHFAHLGARVLRTEAAVLAALAIVRAKLGLA